MLFVGIAFILEWLIRICLGMPFTEAAFWGGPGDRIVARATCPWLEHAFEAGGLRIILKSIDSLPDSWRYTSVQASQSSL